MNPEERRKRKKKEEERVKRVKKKEDQISVAVATVPTHVCEIVKFTYSLYT